VIPELAQWCTQGPSAGPCFSSGRMCCDVTPCLVLHCGTSRRARSCACWPHRLPPLSAPVWRLCCSLQALRRLPCSRITLRTSSKPCARTTAQSPLPLLMPTSGSSTPSRAPPPSWRPTTGPGRSGNAAFGSQIPADKVASTQVLLLQGMFIPQKHWVYDQFVAASDDGGTVVNTTLANLHSTPIFQLNITTKDESRRELAVKFYDSEFAAATRDRQPGVWGCLRVPHAARERVCCVPHRLQHRVHAPLHRPSEQRHPRPPRRSL